MGEDEGEVIVYVYEEAERGLQESLRRQLSLQYRTELLGTVICFSHMAQYCKKLVAISNCSSSGLTG